jgi:hypothetical protein
LWEKIYIRGYSTKTDDIAGEFLTGFFKFGICIGQYVLVGGSRLDFEHPDEEGIAGLLEIGGF